MSEPAKDVEDLDELIDAYLDGRMASEERARFEERITKDADLRNKVNSATRSVGLVQQALGWMTPGDDFEDKVTTRIVSITQSGQNLQPYFGTTSRSLTTEDPDAQLLADPEAVKEKRRLVILAVVAALLFILAAAAIGYSIAGSMQKPAPESPKKAGE